MLTLAKRECFVVMYVDQCTRHFIVDSLHDFCYIKRSPTVMSCSLGVFGQAVAGAAGGGDEVSGILRSSARALSGEKARGMRRRARRAWR